MSKNAPEKTPLAIHFIAGGTAGLCEALACHPLGIPTEFFYGVPGKCIQADS
jgi:hypothetical protein